MKFLIVTHVEHIKLDNQYFGYAPYVREMNIWLKHVDEVIIVAPKVNIPINPIFESYTHKKINFVAVPNFNITSVKALLITIFKLPYLFFMICKTMRKADHIHLRCPGNMGLIGALVQILFPNKQKTAKYAGNWDPNAKQPFTYKLQRWILSNTFLTKNMQVLVYGEWPNQTKNIKPFFTATYSVDEIQNSEFRIQKEWALQSESIITESVFDSAQSNKLGDSALSLRAESRTIENSLDSARLDKTENKLFPTPDSQLPTSFLFVGTLSKGKQPLYAIQLVKELHKRGKKVTLDLFGEGILRKELENYIGQNNLQNIIRLKGNQTKETVLQAYQSTHFLILPSKSEGWPKVVAEAMFWGCVPLASPVSCVSYMLGNGSRGLLLKEQLSHDTNQLLELLHHPETYQKMANEGQNWSRQFTTDKFEAEIKKLLLR